MRKFIFTAAVIGWASLHLISSADATEPGKIDFAREVLPVLSNKCFVCHGPDTDDDDLVRLDSFAGATKDLGGYRAVDPNEPSESELLSRIFSKDDPMPPEDAEKQLTADEREILQRWVESGGQYAQHWAFVLPKKATPPEIVEGGNTIDAFIARKQKLAGTHLSHQAHRTTLARRAAIVLTGLPPDPDELTAFLKDENADAYERYVDRLIAKPQFGEHQARYWLDAVRYGDTHGLHLDNRRGVFPYRDWIVRAINDNLPVDQFLTWQLAGDLLPNPTLQQIVATGFVRMNPTSGEGGAIAEEYQAKNNFDRTENLGTALLGMTLTCARCHTHKYDPIKQIDYYRLMAFFNNTSEPALDRNKYDYGPHIKAPIDQQQWADWETLNRQRDELVSAAGDLIKVVGAEVSAKQRQAWNYGNTSFRFDQLAKNGGILSGWETHDEAQRLAGQFESLQKKFTTTLIAKELGKPRETRLLRRGEYNLPEGDPLVPDVLPIMGTLPKDAPRNRLGLAKWLTSREHPLVSRVLINRVWQQIFGEGLVRTPEDFGLQGEYPTHPELLDWLAVEYQDSGWNFKHMVKLMVTSRTFRQSAAWRDDVEDPENRLWARGPSYRLDAEVIRDIGLWASQLLDPHMGGEGVKPYQPAGMWKALAHPASNTKEYSPDTGARLYRRSLYVYWKRTSPHPMMTLFDAPDRESSCVRRSRTSTALQSLALLNEIQRVEMARSLAQRAIKYSSNDSERLELLYKLLACRETSSAESSACLSLLDSMRKRYKGNPGDAVALLGTGEAPRDESLDAAEHAAWTQVCLTLLASDLALLLY